MALADARRDVGEIVKTKKPTGSLSFWELLLQSHQGMHSGISLVYVITSVVQKGLRGTVQVQCFGMETWSEKNSSVVARLFTTYKPGGHKVSQVYNN